MSHVRTSPSFADRFERLFGGLRAAHLATAAAGLVTVLACGLAALAGLDYAFELDGRSRAVGLALAVTVLPLLVLALAVRALRVWNRRRTAAEIERRHPELGQSVRTTVEYGDCDDEQLRARGVVPALVAALEAETGDRTEPIRFDELVPRGRAVTALLLAAALVAAVFVPTRFDWQWRTAVERALLAGTPYTTVEAAASHDRVEAGNDVVLTVDVHGRTPDEVTVLWRNGGETAWNETAFAPADALDADGTVATFETVLQRVAEPVEFYAVAGGARSDRGRVDVHDPISVESFDITVEPPAYTGLETTTVRAGSLQIVQGTRLRFAVELDQPPAEAELVLTGTQAGEKEERRMPFDVDGTSLALELAPERDLYFTVTATAEDGTRIEEHRHRIRVREDQPPRVWFEEPYDVVEVHALAEVLVRIRVQDDFGVARAGIVFEINNEEEYKLLSEDFQAALEEQAGGEGGTQRTAAVLERVLPLEYFELTQKDSVAYYAYVEDNFPGGPHRVETKLHFIDVRPFRRLFRVREPGTGDGGGPGVASLDEIVSRQRYGLNRTLGLARRAERGEEVGLNGIERLVRFENELAVETRRLAEFLQAREIEGNDSLFQAEDRMLAAVDSLSVGNYETSSLQQKDALRYLIDARDKIEIALGSQSQVVFTELMRFSAEQAQKLREDREENERTPERLVGRLGELAGTERRIAQGLAGTNQPRPSDDGSDGPTRAELAEMQTDAALEARDVERDLSTMEQVSELAMERINAGARMAESASGAMERGETDEAAAAAGRAAETFDELARHVAGLLARESADKVAAAAAVARDIAAMQRRVSEGEAAEDQSMPGGPNSGEDSSGEEDGQEPDDPDSDEPTPGAGTADEELAGELEQSAEAGKTLVDVLEAIPRNAAIDEMVAISQVEDLLDEENPRETVERMQSLPGRAREGEIEEVRAAAGDVARKMEVLAGKLDTVRRRIVEPRVERLLGLERQAAKLEEELDDLQSESDVTGWHREAARLLEELAGAGVAEEPRAELEAAMQGQGWGGPRARGWNWSPNDHGNLVAPKSYPSSLRAISEELQEHVRELILRDQVVDAEERVPPDYRHLVDRYFKVLSGAREDEGGQP